MSEAIETEDWVEVVFDFVRTIPVGKVLTYGQVAQGITNISVTARSVGYAMAFCPPNVPWHRVVGAGGYFPIGKRDPHLKNLQIAKLEAEGTPFMQGSSERVDMRFAEWKPETDEDTNLSLF